MPLIASTDIASTKSRISVTPLSFVAARRQKIWSWGQLMTYGRTAFYQRHRIVAYSAYIFKTLGVSSACCLYGMHPGKVPSLVSTLHGVQLRIFQLQVLLDLHVHVAYELTCF